MFFLYFIIISIGLMLVLLFSKFQIEVKKFRILANKEKLIIKPNYEISIKVYILRKIKILDKKIKKEDFKNKKRLKNLKDRLKIKVNSNQSNTNIMGLKNIKDTGITLKKTNFNIGFLYSIIPNLLNYFFKLRGDLNLKIKPIYQNENQITLSFNGIFEVDLIHIINTYKVLIGKDKEEKDNGASNRKSYAYNNG